MGKHLEVTAKGLSICASSSLSPSPNPHHHPTLPEHTPGEKGWEMPAEGAESMLGNLTEI